MAANRKKMQLRINIYSDEKDKREIVVSRS
jgi:hypothetical protein